MSKQETIDNSKEDQISSLIDSCATKVNNIPIEAIEQLKIKYLNDNRSYEEIQQEIILLTEKVQLLEQLVNRNIDSNILENSIILIGPMGSGKSTIASLLCRKLNMPHVSLDNRSQLASLYEQRYNFANFKDFEFYLTGTVLTNLSEPTIIDFGAGHSVYEDVSLFLEMKSLLSKFNNVILLIPSDDKEASIAIINERKGISPGSKEYHNNKHFVSMPCNYELATYIEYTKNKSKEQISNEIINHINNKETTARKYI